MSNTLLMFISLLMSSSVLMSSEASDKHYATPAGTVVNYERVYSEGINKMDVEFIL